MLFLNKYNGLIKKTLLTHKLIPLSGLLALIISAWFSVGFHHPDEHVQIIEFANYKLGFNKISDLPWEYLAKIRSGFQVLVAFLFIKLCWFIGFENPFVIEFILRLSIGIAVWLLLYKFCNLVLKNYKHKQSGILLIFLAFLLWFQPYLNVRFSSENLSSLLFLFSLYKLLKSNFNPNKTLAFALGVILMLSFFTRFQMAFAILGLLTWLVANKKVSRNTCIFFLFGALVSLFLNLIIDYWLYRQWVFSPFNYFKENIVNGQAASKFGTEPWYYYFTTFINIGFIPISIVLLILLIVGIYKHPKSLFVLIFLCFLIPHITTSHKEMRFLFPVSFIFILIVCNGFDGIYAAIKEKKWLKWVLKLLIVLNTCVLLFRVFAPAHDNLLHMSYINFHKKSLGNIFSIKESAFNENDLKFNFYKPKYFSEIVLPDTNSLLFYLNTTKSNKSFLVYKASKLKFNLKNKSVKRIYCTFPNWVLRFNFFNWQSRANIVSIFQVTDSIKAK
ncbi:MAG: hypothetical protein JSU07_07420 [Bacteroidetes bacterium]|nr:hypothetical protein [Bacteroidota bacterium]